MYIIIAFVIIVYFLIHNGLKAMKEHDLTERENYYDNIATVWKDRMEPASNEVMGNFAKYRYDCKHGYDINMIEDGYIDMLEHVVPGKYDEEKSLKYLRYLYDEGLIYRDVRACFVETVVLLHYGTMHIQHWGAKRAAVINGLCVYYSISENDIVRIGEADMIPYVAYVWDKLTSYYMDDSLFLRYSYSGTFERVQIDIRDAKDYKAGEVFGKREMQRFKMKDCEKGESTC